MRRKTEKSLIRWAYRAQGATVFLVILFIIGDINREDEYIYEDDSRDYVEECYVPIQNAGAQAIMPVVYVSNGKKSRPETSEG